jgi:hypothetical protein
MSVFFRATAVVVLALAISPLAAFAQGVGINATGAAADTSALLDLGSTTKGFLAPRMTALQRAAIFAPATGLLVYQTDGTAGLYYNAGSAGAPAWKLLVDSGSATPSQWTTVGPDIYYSGRNVGIGRSAPAARLDVLGGNWDVSVGEGDLRVGDDTYRLKIGVATLGAGAGVAAIMQQGVPGGYNVLSLGAQGNRVLYVNGGTQRVGIGVDGPTAPLGFGTALGKKITLYPAGTGDYGFGIAPGRLQIYSEVGGTDVAIGYDAAGSFIERLAVKNNGALAVSGSTGSAGQVLQSNGSAAPTSWVSPTNAVFNNTYSVSCNPVLTVYTASTPETTIPGLTQTFSVATNAKVLVSWTISLYPPLCSSCGPSRLILYNVLDGGANLTSFFHDISNNQRQTASGTFMIAVGPGTHTIDLRATASGPDVSVGNGFMTLQVMQQ